MSQTALDLVIDPEPGEHAQRLRFVVLDPPRGKGRPRFGGGRAYTDAATKHAESAVRSAWEDAGGLTLPPSCALACQAQMYLARPQGHYKRDGTLSAEGLRTPRPLRKPDVDNAAKLLLDALEGYAYPADAAIVYLRVLKWWSETGDIGPRSEITLWVVA